MQGITSLFDALVPRLDLRSALILTQCSKDTLCRVSQSFGEIVCNDNETPLVKLYKMADKNESVATPDTLKTFKDEVQIQPRIFMNLLMNDMVLDNWDLQDIYINYMFSNVKNIYTLEKTVSKLILEVYKDECFKNIEIVKRLKQFTFLIRVLGVCVRWVISSGNQDNVSLIRLRTFKTWCFIEQQIGYFQRCMFSFPKGSGAARAKFAYALKKNDKFFIAYIKLLRGISNDELYISPKGGLYTLKNNGRTFKVFST